MTHLPLEQQVAALKYSKELDKLVKLKTVFSWVINTQNKHAHISMKTGKAEHYAAPTCSELLERLPAIIEIDHELEEDPGTPYLTITKIPPNMGEKEKYSIEYVSAYAEYPKWSREDNFGWDESLCNRAALILIYLIKNHYIDVKSL